MNVEAASDSRAARRRRVITVDNFVGDDEVGDPVDIVEISWPTFGVLYFERLHDRREIALFDGKRFIFGISRAVQGFFDRSLDVSEILLAYIAAVTRSFGILFELLARTGKLNSLLADRFPTFS
ncbi:hypothetical protein [Mesorhizobium sp. IMUNJ 23232]|uniref:hypothetical protein n=1 Tax=Mesorhizobium sp. IMUNJ 23232 TaxID=3376064 RepID=UPI0037C89F74